MMSPGGRGQMNGPPPSALAVGPANVLSLRDPVSVPNRLFDLATCSGHLLWHLAPGGRLYRTPISRQTSITTNAFRALGGGHKAWQYSALGGYFEADPHGEQRHRSPGQKPYHRSGA